ncbi:response regulator [uncultured Clostridium sp.]|uniref:response regulator n=1 Tax=uncultured Clostridium sp. TaxID=59620 RepID=UPI0028EF03D9|nr:response regulator [uncultured Clostridium sp.]
MIKVLIVEDDPMVAQINRKYVESIDEFIVIGVCNNGKEALGLIKEKEVNLIILDQYMPKLDGLSFLKELRSLNIMTDIIMVTAADDTDILNEVLKLGAVDYLIKPFEYERFRDALNKFKMRYRIFNSKPTINQGDIDKITNANSIIFNEDVQKGINERTLNRIKNFIKRYEQEYFTCEEIAEEMKLSRVTIRRYLEYLNLIEEVCRDVEYGEVGRPKTTYKCM